MTKILVAFVALTFFALIPATSNAANLARAKVRKVASDGADSGSAPAQAPAPTETAKSMADGGLDSILASKVTPIEGADHRCGNEKGGFAFNTKSKRIWQTGESPEAGLELSVKSLSVDGKVEGAATLENLVHYAFSGSWSDLSVKLSGDGEEETFKLSCR